MEGVAPEAMRAALWSRLRKAGYPVDQSGLSYWDLCLIAWVKEMEDDERPE